MSSTNQKERTKCEIWTRVMGYHRPVSQYNFGKKSEFYSRTYFRALANSNQRLMARYGDTVLAEKKVENSLENASFILFTTTTCPKCPAVKSLLQNSEIEYLAVDNTMDNFGDLTSQYGVQSVPTLIAVDKNGKELSRVHELSEIQELINLTEK